MLHKLLLRLLAAISLAALISTPSIAAAQTLLSQGKPAVASSTEGGFTASLAVDGNTGSRWASNYNNAEWIYVDLGAPFTINRVLLNWEAAFGRGYQIQVSDNGTNWTTVFSTTTGDGATDDLAVAGSGRYVRMNGITRGTGFGYSLYEFQVYGSPISSTTLLSRGKNVVASSQEGPWSASNVVDGNTGSRWGSNFTNTEWIYIDLGTDASVRRVVLNWEAAYGKSYQIQTSDNASSWTTIYSTTTSDGGIDDLTLTGTGRYVRMNGQLRATGYGYSLFEFEIWGTTNSGSSSSYDVRSSSSRSSVPSSVSTSKSSASVSTSKSSSSVSTSRSSASSQPATSSSVATSASSKSSSSTSSCREGAPAAPTGLNAVGVSSTGLVLSWSPSVTATCGVTTNYNVYRDGVLIGSPSAGSTSLTISGLLANTSYTFTVTGFNIFGASAQSTPLTIKTLVNTGTPNFGPNVQIFDPAMPTADIQSKVNAVFAIQENNQFGTPRTALLFKPGTYNIDIPVGFFTHVLGLGAFPDQVKIASVRSEAVLPNNNATQNFWRGVENFAVFPNGGMRWGVSQAVPFRRMHVLNNNIILSTNFGWASGGWMADSLVDNDVTAWAQQQWVSRNSQWGSWSGALWNMVYIGIPNNLPGGTWPTTANTFINTTPIVREKPFLYLNGNNYEVFVPPLKFNSSGISWANNQQAGTSLPIDAFYVARSDVDTAASINSALSQGKHLLLTPGVYRLTEPIQVTRANTIVLGMGFATLQPVTGKKAITVADVDGVILAHLMVDADTNNSPVLVEIGDINSNASHTSNPTSVSDVFVRVGGNGPGKATVAMQINSNDVIIDHTWLWRADHGEGAGWNSNTSRNGLIVNGNNVTAYGLFVEHFQEYQVLWNGNNGRTYFYQSEIPYDPPTQAAYTSGPGVNGWASYKVADTVTNHEAWGLGIYSVFTFPNVNLSHAIEVPNTSNVKFHHMVTVNLTANGAIQNVINNTGGTTSPGVATNTPRVTDYPAQ